MAFVPRENIERFQAHFQTGGAPTLYRAPGRVNLIGEHTDYNLGYVLPIALEMACYVAIAPASHNELRIYSRDFDKQFAIPLQEIGAATRAGEWHDYVIGVAQELTRLEIALSAADILVASEVPVGSGLSSSAALEIGTAVALLGERTLPKVELAKLGQRAESQFVGMPCGIMDQYASVFGHAGAALKIDCRSLGHEYVELPAAVRIIAVNSQVKHELGSSAYRERVAECKQAVEALRKYDASIESLRDVTMEFFQKVEQSVPETPRKRARHVISDTQRVVDLASAARANDLERMGSLFVASHRSMQHDYEISCEEIDFLVDTAIQIPGVYGARMTGGGFGGCTVNLVAPAAVGKFQQRLCDAYGQRFGKTPIFYDCKPAEGAGRV